MSRLQFFPLSELGACARRQPGFCCIIRSSGTPQAGSALFSFASGDQAAAASVHFLFHFRAFPSFTSTPRAGSVLVAWGQQQPSLF